MFSRLLIANRGEIACRIATTARRLGIHTIAVYSDADSDSRHVALCDEAWRLGPAAAAGSYLNAERVLEVARRSAAQAIHPGYGFLAENADFALAVSQQGLIFIGPSAPAISTMGDKRLARRRMEQIGVPVTAGYHGDEQTPADLARAAARIGYPVLIKPALGGGGKGMRIVPEAAQFDAMLASCRREARSAFGDDQMLLERWLIDPRHIEIQILADAAGHCVHLFERDCSVQRRQQKVIEEAPAPGIGEELRDALGRTAIAAARAVDYVGAGTVEFLVDADGAFHFMEMNTRLQVEHPVTEMITGLDLVEWQLRIADGQMLPFRQDDLRIRGHAIEARIYAENPDRDFLPSTGTVQWLRTPDAVEFGCHGFDRGATGRGMTCCAGSTVAPVRIDGGVRQDDAIGPQYDPMIAKLITHGDDRDQALARMRQALAAFAVVGVSTNIDFLARLVDTGSFVAGRIDTGLIEREHERLFPPPAVPSLQRRALAAAAVLAREHGIGFGSERRWPPVCPTGSQAGGTGAWLADKEGAWSADPWNARQGWRSGRALVRTLEFIHDGMRCPLRIEYAGDAWRICEPGVRIDAALPPGGQPTESAKTPIIRLTHLRALDRTRTLCAAAAHVPGLSRAAAVLLCTFDDRSFVIDAVFIGTTVHVFSVSGHDAYSQPDVLAPAADGDDAGPVVAPMPGRVIAVFVSVGSRVERGQALLAIEAMKMEHTVTAPTAGRVDAIHFDVDDQVVEGERLVEFTPADADRAQ